MGFYREKTKDYFLLDTQVENMFINEYMVGAPGEYVKVYLFALMYAQLGVTFSNEDIAKQLSMEIEDVLKAWTYWEKMGIIRKVRTSADNPLEYDVTFVLLKGMLYGSHEDSAPAGSEQGINAQMASPEYRAMFEKIEKAFGRVISGTHLAMSSYRVQRICSHIGEAAGTAAAMAALSKTGVRDIDVELLKQKSREYGITGTYQKS